MDTNPIHAFMRVLVACEFSGLVRNAFIVNGCDAVSCDLLPSELPGPHIQDDVRNHLKDGWDMMIAFPPCTHLAVSGARWFKYKHLEQNEALDFVSDLFNCGISRISIENPVSIISTHFGKPDQIIQPYLFGHAENKTTCLWLDNLPKLVPTNVVVPSAYSRIHNAAPGVNQWRERSRTYLGIAQAMASQWGRL